MADLDRELSVLLWHVHGSWTTSFVQGPWRTLLPWLPEGGPWGRGRCGRDWPERAEEVPADRLAERAVDVVVLQRPEERDQVERLLGRRPGRDVPAVYVEHNTPREHAATTRHPLAERPDVPIVHVTHFNRLMWDNGRAPTEVVEHGVVDPGERYTGELGRVAALINEPVRRGRVTGTDLLPTFAEAAPIDVYGIGVDELAAAMPAGCAVTGVADLGQHRLHEQMARRRAYLHTARWTSLGLSLLEAMHLGMPVLALATTEAPAAVPAEAGVVSADVDVLKRALRELLADPARARLMGKAAREYALTHYGLGSFLRRWGEVLAAATAR